MLRGFFVITIVMLSVAKNNFLNEVKNLLTDLHSLICKVHQ